MTATLGERIAQQRNLKRETQQQLADAIGVTRAVVAKWEKGMTMIKAEDVVLIAKHFEITTDELLLGSFSESATKLSYKTGISGTSASVLEFDSRLAKCVNILLTYPSGIDFLLATLEYIENMETVEKYDKKAFSLLSGDYDLKGWVRFELMRKLPGYLDKLIEEQKANGSSTDRGLYKENGGGENNE